MLYISEMLYNVIQRYTIQNWNGTEYQYVYLFVFNNTCLCLINSTPAT